MDLQEKIALIERVLQSVGESSTSYRVAQLLGISPSTVLRWISHESIPRPKQQEVLDLLYRIAKAAHDGNVVAKQLFEKLVNNRNLNMMAIGLPGVIGLLGLSWLVNGTDDES